MTKLPEFLSPLRHLSCLNKSDGGGGGGGLFMHVESKAEFY